MTNLVVVCVRALRLKEVSADAEQSTVSTSTSLMRCTIRGRAFVTLRLTG